MDIDSIRRVVVDSVLEIAPEADFSRVDPGRSMREQIDLDSFDFLNLLIALQGRLGVAVPESDYRLVDSLDGLVTYLAQHQGPGGVTAA
ncbi:MAG TPA: acyl carrier protein [Ideonella sp.]|uniref:acyl carrier protein n=1 Tax=Ideonella sp. TaxID=1929293 RepID=UPI002E321CAD|nr:acyl carrier protein [Ideonella sp.]HEX5685122.1 acyl carrier protein [Ideonella sp.]